ncbi:MAG TPA: sulfatase [Gaiellaceae bacterium]|nr:sulfatase [Gaiellaceae bacterium]
MVLALLVAAPAGASTNVVVVVTDDQRTGTVAPNRTPAIWNLIRRPGVSFPNAHVPTSVCCPSRASILTGLFAHSHGVYTNGPDQEVPGGWPTFLANGMEERTIAVALQNAGYRTGLVGKYMNSVDPAHVPAGWSYFVRFAGRYYDYLLDGTTFGSEPEDYSTDVLGERAVSFIRTTPDDQPLFLLFTPYAPHSGSIPAPRHENTWHMALKRTPASFREDLADKPPWLRRLPRTGLRKFVDVLERRTEATMAVDEAVGKIVAELEASGRLHDTLIVFLSDNGILLGEHHVYGHKNLPYRAATNVPMFARWDGRLPAGATSSRLVLNVDLAPTIADAAGIQVDSEGRSLLAERERRGFPLEAAAWRHRNRLSVPAFCGYRTKRYAYVHYDGGFEELYDYLQDPQELENRARSPHFAARRDRLRALAVESCAPPPPGFSW